MNRTDSYLDYAAGAPLLPAARDAYLAADVPGNPSALHRAGRRARETAEAAREQIAQALGAQPAEVILTSGGTEADGLAIQGLYRARQAGPTARPLVLVSAVEHHAVLDNAQLTGGQVVTIPAGPDGMADLTFVERHLATQADQTALISLMAANNETGALQPVQDLVALAAAAGVPVHCDAVQLVGKAPFSFGVAGLAAATVSAHKLGGPVGVGALLAGRGAAIKPVIGGGGQERGVRSGTIDARGAAGFAAALVAATANTTAEAARLEALLAPLDALVAGHPDLSLNTPLGRHLPGLRNIALAGARGEALVYLLDQQGIAVSTGSACTAGLPQASHVLLAMGQTDEQARSAIRVSLGWATTAADVAALVAALPAAVAAAQRAAAVPPPGQGAGVDR
ncbi:MAG: aminotransferase class V-fold PLP-dependent enzyme [Bifidobacteriaceae bacterium]|nr:aminotransferase class V-fold PLP-dependent enzyme [Bifidobacteriaceae bacterium]